MKAALLRAPCVPSAPALELAEVAVPQPSAGQVLRRVLACGVCRTDLLCPRVVALHRAINLP